MMRRKGNGDIDQVFRALGGLGRYQLLQVLVATFGTLGAAYQLLGNIFIGKVVSTSHQCARPDNISGIATAHLFDWNSSFVTYGKCEITVSKDNYSSDSRKYPCLFGYQYGFPKEQSFRAEFDLVCERRFLGGLAQTLVIAGQGVGAVFCSMCADRWGRKKVLVMSQLGLLSLGVAVGFVPSYAVLAVLKFLLGAVQQGLVMSMATMGLEWFPVERRSLSSVLGSTLWATCTTSLALLAYLFQDHSWRHLQFALSAASAIAVFQFWYLDESLRWLLANGKKQEAMKILERAARVNGKDLAKVLAALEGDEELDELAQGQDKQKETQKVEGVSRAEDHEVDDAVEQQKNKKLNMLDLFRNRRLLFNASIVWIAWFTVAFSFFSLYMMSTSLHGNRFLNYFLTALMELIPGFIFYFMVDRVGRKWAIRPLYMLAGIGLMSSGIFRMYPENPTLKTLSVVSAMLGMIGASGMFGGVFFYTPELFPTNMRSQALGLASFAGRCGGMLAPFMVDLSEMAVWAPGALIGCLCFLVALVIHFLPETKGRPLPDTIDDIEAWYRKPADPMLSKIKTLSESMH